MTTTRNRVQVLHGVNLDMLGSRDPLHYGDFTLPELEVKVKRFARDLSLEAAFFDSNSESEFVEHIHRLPEIADAAIVNAGALTLLNKESDISAVLALVEQYLPS